MIRASPMPDKRNRLAEERTDAAWRRNQAANERTLSAWWRTGLALVVVGFAATRLLDETGPTWLLTLVGVVFVILGGFTFILGYWSYHKSFERGTSGLSRWLMLGLTAVLVALSGVAVVLILNAKSGG